MRRVALACAPVAFLAGCASTPSTTGPAIVSNGWTTVAAADVEVNAALGVVSYLKGFEAQVPGAAASIRSAGQAIATGVAGHADAMVAGASPAVQGKQAAIQAVLALAPNLGTLLTTKQTGSGSQITVAADVAGILINDALYVGPAYLAANAGTITATQLRADEAALAAAAGGL